MYRQRSASKALHQQNLSRRSITRPRKVNRSVVKRRKNRTRASRSAAITMPQVPRVPRGVVSLSFLPLLLVPLGFLHSFATYFISVVSLPKVASDECQLRSSEELPCVMFARCVLSSLFWWGHSYFLEGFYCYRGPSIVVGFQLRLNSMRQMLRLQLRGELSYDTEGRTFGRVSSAGLIGAHPKRIEYNRETSQDVAQLIGISTGEFKEKNFY